MGPGGVGPSVLLHGLVVVAGNFVVVSVVAVLMGSVVAVVMGSEVAVVMGVVVVVVGALEVVSGVGGLQHTRGFPWVGLEPPGGARPGSVPTVYLVTEVADVHVLVIHGTWCGLEGNSFSFIQACHIQSLKVDLQRRIRGRAVRWRSRRTWSSPRGRGTGHWPVDTRKASMLPASHQRPPGVTGDTGHGTGDRWCMNF